MPDKILLVANWKANVVDTKSWLQQLAASSEQLENISQVEITIACPLPFLPVLKDLLAASPSLLAPSLASQDVSMFPPGAYTGELPAQMLASLGVKYALVGHSERRKNLRETNLEVEAKLQQAITNNIIPIICAQTLEEIPDNIRNFDPAKYLIMYEPATAISTNGNYHPDSVENIQSTLTEWQKKLPDSVRFLYGGSVNADNVAPITNNLISHIPKFSGFVIGHASLDSTEFGRIVTSLCNLSA